MTFQELKLNTYTDYMEHLQKNGYNREQINIDENAEIVNKYSLAKGSTGTVLDIRCPSRYKIVVIGKNQLSLDEKIENACALAVRIADSNNEDISPYIRIRIIKERPSLAILTTATMLYKDITSTEYLKNLPNGNKPYEKFYRFNDSIELNGSDRLKVDVINSDKNIDHKYIRLSLDVDLWEQYI